MYYTVRVSGHDKVAFTALFNGTVQWTLGVMYPGSKKEVAAKKTEALKRLGHQNLKLDEYESTVSNPTFLSHSVLNPSRNNRERGYPPR